MAGFAGLRGTGDWGTDERPKNFREMILWANPNGMAPLTAMMARMKTEATTDPEFAWWEEKLDPIRIVTNADLSDSSTSVGTAAGALRLVPGDLLTIEPATELAAYAHEIVVVSSVTSDTAFVIKRGQAGSVAAGLASGGAMRHIGNAFEEGTRSPQTASRNPTKLKNFAQIFKTKVELTETAKGTKARTGDPWANDKKRRSFDHSVGLENAFFFGVPYEVAAGPTKGKPLRYTGGLRYFLTTNNKVYTTSPTEDSFIDFMQPLFNYSTDAAGDERILLCGNTFLTNLNKLARNSPSTRLQQGGVLKIHGMRLMEWTFPFGRVALKTHPLFNVDPRYTASAFILNPTGIIWRPMRETRFQDNIQENDEDTQAGQWLTEGGIEVHHEFTMGYIGNFRI